MPKKVFELDFEGKKLSVEAGEIAKQADGAVLHQLRGTVLCPAGSDVETVPDRVPADA